MSLNTDDVQSKLAKAEKSVKTTATTNKKEVTAKTTEGDVEQIVIPRSMSKLQAADQLIKQHEEEETVIDLIQKFDKWDTNDTLVAIMRTLKKVFGWSPAVPIHTFFGTINPKEINVVVDLINGKEVYEGCFLGRFQVAQWEDANGDVGYTTSDDGKRTVTYIKFQIKKKFSQRAKEFFYEVENTLRETSIFKGKSLMLSKDFEGLRFIENKGSKNVILNREEELVLQNLVINPLGKPGKRCILFIGTYGTGKTESAMRVGKVANEKGITYIYCKDSTKFPMLLETAKQYQPAVVFLEDLDEIGSGEQRDTQMNEILNTLDGVQTKGNDITVIFTTNHEKRINKALRRPGRIDVIIKFNKCEKETIAKIYQKFFEGIQGADTLDYDMLASKTPVVQGAVVAEIAQRAVRIMEANGSEMTNDIVQTAIISMKDQIEFMEENPENIVDPRIQAMDTIANMVSEKVKTDMGGDTVQDQCYEALSSYHG